MPRIASLVPALGAVAAAVGAPLFCAGCGGGDGASAADAAAAKEAYERGLDLIRARDFPAAEEVLVESIGRDDGDAYAHYHLGVARYEQTTVMLGALNVDHAKLGLAIDSLDRAIELDGAVASFHLYRGMALERARAMGGARRAFEEALRLDPASLQARVHLGIVLLHLGEHAAARVELEEAIRRFPKSPVAHHQLGLLHLETTDWNAARDAFAAATTLKPDEPDSWFGLATARRRLNDEAGADAALVEFHRRKAERARRKAPKPSGSKAEALAHFNRGNQLLQAGKLAEAKEAFQAVLALQPETGAAHANLGLAHYHLGEAEKARHHLKEALRLMPGNQKARDLLAQLDVARD